MDTIRIWKGAKRHENGRDLSNYVNVAFEGETLGAVSYGDDKRGVTRTFYRAANGRIVIHEVLWSDFDDEDDIGNVHVFFGLDEAAQSAFRLDLERAGVVERRTLTLDELETY